MTLDFQAEKISMADLSQICRDHRKMWPEDLVDDLEDSDPHLFLERQRQQILLAEKRREITRTQDALIQDEFPLEESFSPKESPSNIKLKKVPFVFKKPKFSPNTIVKPRWDDTSRKGLKNWADMENLLTFYALGILFKNTLMPPQAEFDKAELKKAIEAFPHVMKIRGAKRLTVECRLAARGTYFSFGKRTVEAATQKEPDVRDYRLYLLTYELNEASQGNENNYYKLNRAFDIGKFVVEKLKRRYHLNK